MNDEARSTGQARLKITPNASDWAFAGTALGETGLAGITSTPRPIIKRSAVHVVPSTQRGDNAVSLTDRPLHRLHHIRSCALDR